MTEDIDPSMLFHLNEKIRRLIASNGCIEIIRIQKKEDGTLLLEIKGVPLYAVYTGDGLYKDAKLNIGSFGEFWND